MASRTGKNIPTTPKYNPHRPNMWGFLQVFLVTAIQKGQLLTSLCFITLIVIIGKMEPGDVYFLANKMLDSLIEYEIFGWGLSVTIGTGWVLEARFVRKIYKERIDQISQEKTDLHRQLTNKKMSTSETLAN